MAPNYSKPSICNICLHQGSNKAFPSTTCAVHHVMDFHHVFHPEKINIFVDVELTTIANIVNRRIGRQHFDYNIKNPSNRPICYCCPQLLFPSWDYAVVHSMSYHQIFNYWAICQNVGKNVLGSIPEIRKTFRYTCYQCQQPRLFHMKKLMIDHMKNHHGMPLPEEVDNNQQLSTRSSFDVPQPNAPQTEPERETIAPPNIQTTPPEEMDNNQQLSTRPSSPVDSKFPICLFFFHKSMLRKQETKRKLILDEDGNEENLKLPKKKMKSNPKKSISP